jgi:acylphosphatase
MDPELTPCVPVPSGAKASDTIEGRRVLLRGRVQGVGFRPFVHRLAGRLDLCGWVRNLAGQVVIHVEGTVNRLDEFQAALIAEAPSLARPAIVETAVVSTGLDAFFIEESAAGANVDISVPPDVALCSDCRRELRDPRDRRHRYPFLNCTQCGPRYTIIASLPYDRARTSMERFPLCPECQAEYEDIENRRYHAEPVACPACGPRVELVDFGEARDLVVESPGDEWNSGSVPNVRFGDDALVRAVGILGQGGIVGLQGIGGYHLICDATSTDAVRRLRAHKRRPGKPLAVMVPREGADGLDAARRLVEIRPEVAAALTSGAHPIVLARRVRDFDRCGGGAGRNGPANDAMTSEELGPPREGAVSRGEPPRELAVGRSGPPPGSAVGEIGRTNGGIAGEAGANDGRVVLEVAPGLEELGVMLPYSPLHELLRLRATPAGNRWSSPAGTPSGSWMDWPMHSSITIGRFFVPSTTPSFGTSAMPSFRSASVAVSLLSSTRCHRDLGLLGSPWADT